MITLFAKALSQLMKLFVKLLPIVGILFAISCGSGQPDITVTRINVDKENQKATKGDRIQIIATGLFSNGTSRDISNEVKWNVRDPQTAEILQPGLIHILGIGNIVIVLTDPKSGIQKEFSIEGVELVSSGDEKEEEPNSKQVLENPTPSDPTSSDPPPSDPPPSDPPPSNPPPINPPPSNPPPSNPPPSDPPPSDPPPSDPPPSDPPPSDPPPSDPPPTTPPPTTPPPGDPGTSANCAIVGSDYKLLDCQKFNVVADTRYRFVVNANAGTNLPMATVLYVESADTAKTALCNNTVFAVGTNTTMQCDFAIPSTSSITSVAASVQTGLMMSGAVSVQLVALQPGGVFYQNESRSDLAASTDISGTAANSRLVYPSLSTYQLASLPSQNTPYIVYLYDYSNVVPMLVETISGNGDACTCPVGKQCLPYTKIYSGNDPVSGKAALICEIPAKPHEFFRVDVTFDDNFISDNVYLPARAAGGVSFKLRVSPKN